MAERVVPMIHVPDVRATVEWYQSIGFTVIETYGDDGDGLSFAVLSFGSSRVMFNSGGQSSSSHRRDIDLYVYTSNVDEIYERLKDRVEVIEGPHDKFYGMREFLIRDLNRFWMTFGQTSYSEFLMSAVWERNAESVRVALDRGGLNLNPETLTRALAAASTGDNRSVEIAKMLETAGAIPPPEVDVEILESYAGKFQGQKGFEINVTFREGRLFAELGSQQPLSLMAVDRITFKPVAFDDYGTLIFDIEAGKTTGCVLKHAGNTTQLTRVEETRRL